MIVGEYYLMYHGQAPPSYYPELQTINLDAFDAEHINDPIVISYQLSSYHRSYNESIEADVVSGYVVGRIMSIEHTTKFSFEQMKKIIDQLSDVEEFLSISFSNVLLIDSRMMRIIDVVKDEFA